MCSNLNSVCKSSLDAEYLGERATYTGSPLTHDFLCDVEQIDCIISDIKLGKAASLDELTSEHLKFCHPVLALAFIKLFNIKLKCGQVPNNFRNSYTVPIPKGDYIHGRELKVDDFRGISICPIISKLFEKCILQQFNVFLSSSDSQFAFKPGLNCSHAIYSVRKVVDH